MEQNTKVTAILEALKGDYPEPRCALEYQKDYELMVAVRLSAQCTDARVNEVTPALFVFRKKNKKSACILLQSKIY